MEGLWQRSTFTTQQLIITTLLLTVHLRTAAGHQVSSSSPSSSSSSSSSPSSSSSLHPNELHQNTSSSSSSTSTTLSVATAFLRQLEHYQREQHYGAVRRLLENEEVHRSLSLSTETSTEADRTCLAMLRHALRHPLGSRWTAKRKWKDK